MGNIKEKMTGTVVDFGEDEGTWFSFFTSRIKDDGTIKYDDPAPGAGKVCVRAINEFVESYWEKQKKKTEFVLNPKTRAMEHIEYSKDMNPAQRKRYQSDLWDYAITNWENFFDAKKKPIECILANKVKMMKVQMFDRFVSKCLKTMNENTVKQASELTENL